MMHHAQQTAHYTNEHSQEGLLEPDAGQLTPVHPSHQQQHQQHVGSQNEVSQHQGHNTHGSEGLMQEQKSEHIPAPQFEQIHTSHLQQMREYPTDVSLLKRPMSQLTTDDLLSSGTFLENQGSATPDRKRRKTNGEQQIKRLKYDVLKAFFRVYFKVDDKSAVLKDAMYNLYARKINPESRIARNAMYRHMWHFFRDKIKASQSNYREYVKGIKLLSNQTHLNYEGAEKDIELLRNSGVTTLFDFQEEDLAKSDKAIGGYVSNQYLEGGDSDIYASVENLEVQLKTALAAVKEIKQKLKKKD